ncbi:hypothetical protein LXL04_000560 [Taraxacum kok-saghyz]
MFLYAILSTDSSCFSLFSFNKQTTNLHTLMENKNNSTSSPSSQPPPPQPSPPRSSSSSSFTAELFGDNDSPPSSTGVFSSIFSPPSTVFARNPNCPQFAGATQSETSESQVWTTTHVTAGEKLAKNTASVMNMEGRSIFQERVEPSPLSSSLYYGGQEDMYVCSSSDPTSQSYSKFKKLDGKDDPNHLHSACRGNWWQG